MRTTVGLFFCFLKMREFWIEIELTVAVPGYLAIFYVKSFTMFHLNKTVSVLILMSAITDGFTWCFVKVLFALFTTIALMIRQLLTLIYCNIIVPKFIFVCTYTRLSAWCLIESILAIFVKIAIFQRQMLTVLHNFVITTEFFLVSASRSKVSCFSRRHIVFLIENIWFVMYKMPVNYACSQVNFSFIIQIAILVTLFDLPKFVIKRPAPGLPVAKSDTFIKCFMMNFQSWLKIESCLHLFKPILIGCCDI